MPPTDLPAEGPPSADDLSDNPPAESPGAESLVLGPPLAPPEPALSPAAPDAGPEAPEARPDPPAEEVAAPPPGAPSFLLLTPDDEGFVFGAAPFVGADPAPAPAASGEAEAPVAAPLLHDAPSDPPVVEPASGEDPDPESSFSETPLDEAAPAAPEETMAETPLPPLLLSPDSHAIQPPPEPLLPWEDPASAAPPPVRPGWQDPAAAVPDWPELRRNEAAERPDAGLAAAVLSAAQASLPDPGGPSAPEPATPGLPPDLRAQIAEMVREEVQKGLASLHEALRAELAPKPKAPRAARKKG